MNGLSPAAMGLLTAPWTANYDYALVRTERVNTPGQVRQARARVCYEEPEGEMVFADDPDDMCRVECSVCLEGVKVLRAHVRSHDMSIGQYREIYPVTRYTKKTYHRYAGFIHF